ncbi:ester cyclase [Stutzerimonas stutzeri]|uniref:Ester cyclase n=1 Tax=Stutzerimonas stutzeri TaxID=316 RepID=W8R0Z5_STUST|nr:ester cyclase [Stutzerimonas stutzeri]AHL76274.1 ester cyclase [Stutzerimonas stutzeri]MCQ4329503.1 ester cyclase [Stutzerimonas stutzeri]
MTGDEITDCYRGYIACLNSRNWPELERFVHDEVLYNGKFVGLGGYRQMLEGDVQAIPDLQFNIGLLIAEPPHVAAQLRFACTPIGELFGYAVNGKRVAFIENVFYEFGEGKIRSVWSVIDKAAVGDQL